MIIISGDKIGFQLHRGFGGHLGRQTLSLDALFTPKGFIIPSGRSGTEVLSYINNEEFDLSTPSMIEGAVIVQHTGRAYIYGRHNKTFIMRPILYGPGYFETFCIESSQDSALDMAGHLTNYDIQGTFDLYRKAYNARDDLIIMSFADIAARLVAEEKTGLPIPAKSSKAI